MNKYLITFTRGRRVCNVEMNGNDAGDAVRRLCFLFGARANDIRLIKGLQ